MGKTMAKLKELGIILPPVPALQGNYILYKRVEQYIYLSGQSAFVNGIALYPGKVGNDVRPIWLQEKQDFCACQFYNRPPETWTRLTSLKCWALLPAHRNLTSIRKC